MCGLRVEVTSGATSPTAEGSWRGSVILRHYSDSYSATSELNTEEEEEEDETTNPETEREGESFEYLIVHNLLRMEDFCFSSL